VDYERTGKNWDKIEKLPDVVPVLYEIGHSFSQVGKKSPNFLFHNILLHDLTFLYRTLENYL